MIKIDTLKEGDTFFHSHINKVYECKIKKEMYLFEFALNRNGPVDLIEVYVTDDFDTVLSRKDEQNLFVKREDAESRHDELIKLNYEYFANDGWIKELWHLYNVTFNESPRKENLRRVIKEKTGITVK